MILKIPIVLVKILELLSKIKTNVINSRKIDMKIAICDRIRRGKNWKKTIHLVFVRRPGPEFRVKVPCLPRFGWPLVHRFTYTFPQSIESEIKRKTN